MTVPTKSRFQRYLTVITRWVLVSGSVFGIVFFSGQYATANWLTKYYAATAQIQIRNATPGDTSITPAELETILSADVLLPVIQDHGLDVTWARRTNPDEDALTNLEAVAYIDKMLRLDSPRGTDLVNITAVSDVPKEAADIANGIAQRYKTIREAEMAQKVTALSSPVAARADSQDSPAVMRVGITSASAYLVPVVAQDSDAPSPSSAVLRPGPVRIVSLAEIPTTPFRPNTTFCFYFSLVAASAAGLMAASFVEVIFLFVRAEQANRSS